MNTDKLSAEQRLNLEALNQAVATFMGQGSVNTETVLQRAAAFAEFLKTGRVGRVN